MSNTFPRDCWNKKCPHFKVWDMSIDDLCCRCDLLQIQCDACDEMFSFFLCPMKDDEHIKE